MRVYEIVVKATVSDTFRIIADNDKEATEKACLMFKNDVTATVLKVQFDVLEPDDENHS